MKKLLLVILLFNSVRLFAQTPDWIWANSAGGNGVDEGNSVATDATGNMIATGYFKSDSITFGTTVLINSDSSSLTQDFFIVKYDSSGNVLWAKSAGGGNDDKGKGVAIDLSGNIIVTGSFRSDTITFSYLLANAGNENIFIVKYDPSGNILWSKSAGGTGFYDAANSITTDGDGNIIIAGDFGSNSIPFGTTYLYNFGAINGFVVKYDSLGNVLWAKSVGGSGEETISSVTTDPTGNIIIAGGI